MARAQDEDMDPVSDDGPDAGETMDFALSQQDLQERERAGAREEEQEMRRASMQIRVEKRAATNRESERFLRLMKDKGGGNIALAWRRFFDSDGDGNLSFREFCAALVELKYKGDVPALWNELGGHATKSLSLDAVDPENAEVLDYFGNWCERTRGGPFEVFKLIDDDGSDSLTADEFAKGLREFGFFDEEGVLPLLETEEAVLANLFPLLDQNGYGCIAPGQMLFLEKDASKKIQLERQLERIAKHGAEAAPEPLPNTASKMLHTLATETTVLGGKHWKALHNVHTERASPKSALASSRKSRLGMSGNLPSSRGGSPKGPRLSPSSTFNRSGGLLARASSNPSLNNPRTQLPTISNKGQEQVSLKSSMKGSRSATALPSL